MLRRNIVVSSSVLPIFSRRVPSRRHNPDGRSCTSARLCHAHHGSTCCNTFHPPRPDNCKPHARTSCFRPCLLLPYRRARLRRCSSNHVFSSRCIETPSVRFETRFRVCTQLLALSPGCLRLAFFRGEPYGFAIEARTDANFAESDFFSHPAVAVLLRAVVTGASVSPFDGLVG